MAAAVPAEPASGQQCSLGSDTLSRAADSKHAASESADSLAILQSPFVARAYRALQEATSASVAQFHIVSYAQNAQGPP